MLISAPGGRFPRGGRSVNRTTKSSICRISVLFAEIKASLRPNALLLVAKTVLRYGFSAGSSAQAIPAGVAAFRSNQRTHFKSKLKLKTVPGSETILSCLETSLPKFNVRCKTLIELLLQIMLTPISFSLNNYKVQSKFHQLRRGSYK